MHAELFRREMLQGGIDLTNQRAGHFCSCISVCMRPSGPSRADQAAHRVLRQVCKNAFRYYQISQSTDQCVLKMNHVPCQIVQAMGQARHVQEHIETGLGAEILLGI